MILLYFISSVILVRGEAGGSAMFDLTTPLLQVESLACDWLVGATTSPN